MREVRELLHEARVLYDDPRHALARSARAAALRGFAGGGQWMRAALCAMRGHAPAARPSFHRLGFSKYCLSLLAAAPAAVLLGMAAPWLLPAGLLVFYAVESRMVFAFPLALDGSRAPLGDSHALVAATVPAPIAVASVMRIAAEMVFGGLCGRGLLRSWCVGCLAVLLWYEDALAARPVPA